MKLNCCSPLACVVSTQTELLWPVQRQREQPAGEIQRHKEARQWISRWHTAVPRSPVSSHGETGYVRSAPSRASAQQWWYQSKAAWSRGSSAWFHPQPTVGASFWQALRPVWGCTPALLPPASSCPLMNAVTSPPWSHPISSSRCVSTWHQGCLAAVLSSTGSLLQGTTRRRRRTQKHSKGAVHRSSDRDPHLTRAGRDRMKWLESSCQVGAHQVWRDNRTQRI